MRGPAALEFKEAWNFLPSMRNEECAGMSWNAHPKIVLRGWIVWKTTTQINTAEDWLLRLYKQWLNDLIIHSLSGESYRFVHITKTVKNIYLSQSSSKLQICVFSANSVMARLLELLLRLPPVPTTRCPRVYGSNGPRVPGPLFFLKESRTRTPHYGVRHSPQVLVKVWSWKTRAIFLAFGIKSPLKRKLRSQLDSRFEELAWVL